tara:strand:- start:1521 stop:1709 length:189 start_codon:yes stop_codon:yes gene_type:complete
MVHTETKSKPIKILLTELENIKVEKLPDGYKLSLRDSYGFEILVGFGRTPIEAINNLHRSIL